MLVQGRGKGFCPGGQGLPSAHAGGHAVMRVSPDVSSPGSPSLAMANMSRSFQSLADPYTPVPRGWESSLGLDRQ